MKKRILSLFCACLAGSMFFTGCGMNTARGAEQGYFEKSSSEDDVEADEEEQDDEEEEEKEKSYEQKVREAESAAKRLPLSERYTFVALDDLDVYRSADEETMLYYVKIPAETELDVKFETEGWYKVSYQDNFYYVQSEFVSKTENMVVPVFEKEELQTGVGRHIVLDPGHQAVANDELEPISPNKGDELKPKATVGSTGVISGANEYEINLQIAMWTKAVLEARGYEVILTRQSNEEDVSNVERALIANSIDPTAYIRIHCCGGTNPDTSGIMTICPTEDNEANGRIAHRCHLLADSVLDCVAETTGADKLQIWETDTMTGINYAIVPVCQVQVGYLSNPRDDEKLQTKEYQLAIAEGIANGIDEFILK